MSKINKEALEFHSKEPKGKISIKLTKKIVNKHDLSLAYSPGVAEPCLEIQKDYEKAYDYTAKGNMVAVITNGTAVLGLGNLGAMASKPVMEGKSALFKRFSGIDSIDVEVEETDPEKFIEIVKKIGNSWGGINLEDIKAPECFIIEETLQKAMDIPVFHDDQHGTAIVTSAGLINALYLTKRELCNVNIVVNGAGAAAIACINLLIKLGATKENIIVCDTRGVIYTGRTEGMNKWKEKLAVNTKHRSLEDAMHGADVFLGLSVKDAVSQSMIKSMAKEPIIFAMANPDPEILPEKIYEVRDDAIVATGRSDYKNQINNFICFPYLFRGALDVRATKINDEMKIAATNAIAQLARKEATEEVKSTSITENYEFSKDYIIPVTFDSRLMSEVSSAVAKAAIDSGVAKKPISDFNRYKRKLSGMLNPGNNLMEIFYRKLTKNNKTIVFAEGEEDEVIKAAADWEAFGYGKAILVGREKVIKEKLAKLQIKDLEITNAAISNNTEQYTQHLYNKHQRNGYLYRDCTRLINRERNIFSSEMVVHKEADALITGITRNYTKTLAEINNVIEKRTESTLFAINIIFAEDKILFIADTAIHQSPSSEILSEIAIGTASEVKKLGITPRVAFISSSTFGSSKDDNSKKIANAIKILNDKNVDFEYDGEMQANVALNESLLAKYPFAKLHKSANILIMPCLRSADIAIKLLSELGDIQSIGPILYGLTHSVQIAPMNTTSTDILNFAAIASNT
ncbi:MAG: malate dehydrogenase (oxaloacetate-decarboxylating)(NADP+) [Candidatus Midichloriaceae bacterium]|jgi:malate dehydrogenase (oxaloacetate-decarboxylating)(NADP+)